MNPYGIDHKESSLLGPITSLKILYEEMPATTGCERCSEVNGNNEQWCCKEQNPSMNYVEFLYVFEEVQKWSKKKRKELILRAIRNYLDNRLSKGCIFFVDGCLVYKRRPFMCFTGETIILTDMGPKPINKIFAGDRVLTHKGRYKTVLRTSSHLSDKPIIQLQIKGDLPIRCTHDHMFLAVLSKDKRCKFNSKLQWTESKNIIAKRCKQHGHYLSFPEVTFGEGTNIINVSDFIECTVIKDRAFPIYFHNAPVSKNVASIPLKINLDESFLWTIGLYLAEGSSNNSSCTFSLHTKEKDTLGFRVKNSLYQLGVNVTESIVRNSLQLIGNGSILAKLMRSLCGKYSDNKSLHQNLFKILNNEQMLHIFNGWCDGDGDSSIGIRYKSVTTSRNLVYQMYFIAKSNGLHPFLYSEKRKNRDKINYQLIIYEADYKLKPGQGNCYKEEDGKLFYPVKKADCIPQISEPVFDLQVKDDESFVTSAGIAHNCRQYGVIPEENWNKRWESLQNRQGDRFEAKPQCNLVSVVDREPITAEEEHKWFSHINKCEQRIGVDEKTIKLHDLPGGSYRTFHDHLLLELFSEDFLHTLTKVRINNPSKEDIDKFIQEVSALL